MHNNVLFYRNIYFGFFVISNSFVDNADLNGLLIDEKDSFSSSFVSTLVGL